MGDLVATSRLTVICGHGMFALLPSDKFAVTRPTHASRQRRVLWAPSGSTTLLRSTWSLSLLATRAPRPTRRPSSPGSPAAILARGPQPSLAMSAAHCLMTPTKPSAWGHTYHSYMIFIKGCYLPQCGGTLPCRSAICYSQSCRTCACPSRWVCVNTPGVRSCYPPTYPGFMRRRATRRTLGYSRSGRPEVSSSTRLLTTPAHVTLVLLRLSRTPAYGTCNT